MYTRDDNQQLVDAQTVLFNLAISLEWAHSTLL